MTRRKGEIVGRTHVDENHDVVSVEGTGGYRRRPCGECPWLTHNDGSFPPGAFIASAHTAYDASMKMFACHESGAERTKTCAGFLLKNSMHNMGVRLALAAGRFDLDQVQGPSDPEELHDSYRSMAEANGVPEDHPALQRCRADWE